MKKHRNRSALMGAAAAALTVCVVVKVLAAGDAGGTGVLTDLITTRETAQRLLNFELRAPALSNLDVWTLVAGAPSQHDAIGDDDTESTDTGKANPEPAPGGDNAPGEPNDTPNAAPDYEIVTSPTTPPMSDDGSLFYEGSLIHPENSDGTAKIDNSKPLSSDGITLRNNSGLDIDADALLKEPLHVELAAEGPQVLIIHTHSSEAYTPATPGEYEMTDAYRTEDKAHNIIRVGDVLAEELAAQGLTVIHDRGVYDYPSYTGSYARTLEAVKKYLAEYPSITLVIDLHRDSIAGADGSELKTIADINGNRCSQVMLVVGTNGSGLDHPNWKNNMKFALRLEYAMNQMYPSLSRPITISAYRYNQHLTPYYLIVEDGASGNTLAESETAIRYFAKVYAKVVLN
jgi:stage II sporulation protein P